jgi:hypothetical protein
MSYYDQKMIGKSIAFSTLKTLLYIEELRQLKARYCRYVDTKQWAAWRSIFTEDVAFAGLSAPFSCLDEFIEVQRERLADAVSVHHCHTVELELTSASSATGVWAMCDYVEYPWEVERRGFVGYGFYFEEYRREKGEWKISRLQMQRLRMDPLVGPHLPAFEWFMTAADGTPIPAGRVLEKAR